MFSTIHNLALHVIDSSESVHTLLAQHPKNDVDAVVTVWMIREKASQAASYANMLIAEVDTLPVMPNMSDTESKVLFFAQYGTGKTRTDAILTIALEAEERFYANPVN